MLQYYKTFLIKLEGMFSDDWSHLPNFVRILNLEKERCVEQSKVRKSFVIKYNW